MQACSQPRSPSGTQSVLAHGDAVLAKAGLPRLSG